ncbi:MAG: amidohydrolase family protein [Candidatus Saccharibacteria bacterium]|nr:amidohydrolase family protein [Microbacteriaceae bacterium]
MIRIDAHQHVWDVTKAQYGWFTPEHLPINRSMTFDEVRPSLRSAGIAASVLVQSADNDEDTDNMLAVAAESPEIVAVVAWLPLDEPERASERLCELRQNPRVVGARTLIHDLPDPDWILRPEVDEGLGVLEAVGVTFDYVAVLPRHLEHVSTLGERHPNLRIVIDHLGAPPIGIGDAEPWWTLIARAAENPLVFAKLSGLYSRAGALDGSVEEIRPFVERGVEVFGADRLMYGGDWPVSLLAGGYERVLQGLSALIGELDGAESDAILGGTAQRFYQIDEELLAQAEKTLGS